MASINDVSFVSRRVLSGLR